MDKSYKKPLLLITFGVILFAAFNNLNYVANFLKSCIGLLAPILSGLLLAFVLSVPVRGLAKRLRRKLTKATDRQIDMISLLLTLICVIAIIALLCVIAIPQLTASVKSIAALVQEKWPDWVGLLQRYGIDTEKLSAHFAALDWKSILQSISSEMNTVISSVANVAGSTVSAISFVFCCRDSICGANSRFNCRLCIRSLYWRISLLRFRHFIYFIGGSEQGAPMLDRLSGNSVC